MILLIAEKRKALGLSQQALSEIVKVNQTAVSQWETGKTSPSSEILPALADALGCTIDELFRRTAPKEE